MHLKSQSCTTPRSGTSAPGLALDSDSLLADEAPLLNFTWEKKRTFDQSFQTLLSESNQELTTVLQEIRALSEELATVLREVQVSSDAEVGSPAQSQPGSELLMRTVQCAVKQQKLQAELSSLALTDQLTGLYNRRGFLCLTERQLKLAGRSGRNLLLFFIDVDGLKRINDTFGHTEGDFALFRTAAVLGLTFRDSDVLARLGGDEFCALAIEASDHSEATIMARLRETLETLSAQEPRYRLSLSVGVVRFTPSTASSIEELMLHADRAMYQTKRNRWSPDPFFARPTFGTEQASSLDHLDREPGLGKRDFA